MTWDLWLMNAAVMGGSAAMDLLYVWWTRSVVADRLIPACVAGHMLGTWVAMHKGERR
jgi:hypothetical protein